MVLEKSLDSMNGDGTIAPRLPGSQIPNPVIGDDSFRLGLKPWQKLKPSIEILCNDQASIYAI